MYSLPLLLLGSAVTVSGHGLLVYPPIWQYGHNTNINKVTQIQGLLHICLYNIDVLVFSYIPDIKRPKGERPEAPLEPIAYSH